MPLPSSTNCGETYAISSDAEVNNLFFCSLLEARAALRDTSTKKIYRINYLVVM